MCGAPDCALDDEIVTTRPHPAAIMSGSAAWMHENVPVRFTARIRFHVSGVMSAAASNDSMPADVTTMPIGPSVGADPLERVVHGRPVGDVDLERVRGGAARRGGRRRLRRRPGRRGRASAT